MKDFQPSILDFWEITDNKEISLPSADFTVTKFFNEIISNK